MTSSVQLAPLPTLIEQPDPLKVIPETLKPEYKPPPIEDLFSVKAIEVLPKAAATVTKAVEKAVHSCPEPQPVSSIKKVDPYPLVIELSDEEADKGSYHPTAPKISLNSVESEKKPKKSLKKKPVIIKDIALKGDKSIKLKVIKKDNPERPPTPGKWMEDEAVFKNLSIAEKIKNLTEEPGCLTASTKKMLEEAKDYNDVMDFDNDEILEEI